MNKEGILINLIKKIKNFFLSLNNKQKLFIAIVLVTLLFILVNLASQKSDSNINSIDYLNITGSNLYTLSYVIEDKDLYVTLKSVADDFISMCLGYKKDENNEKFTSKYIYNYVLDTKYKNFISKRNFSNIVDDFEKNMKLIIDKNYSLIPSDIVEYNNGYYLVKYEYEIDDVMIQKYIGIILDDVNQKYYIWYLE